MPSGELIRSWGSEMAKDLSHLCRYFKRPVQKTAAVFIYWKEFMQIPLTTFSIPNSVRLQSAKSQAHYGPYLAKHFEMRRASWLPSSHQRCIIANAFLKTWVLACVVLKRASGMRRRERGNGWLMWYPLTTAFYRISLTKVLLRGSYAVIGSCSGPDMDIWNVSSLKVKMNSHLAGITNYPARYGFRANPSDIEAPKYRLASGNLQWGGIQDKYEAQQYWSSLQTWVCKCKLLYKLFREYTS